MCWEWLFNHTPGWFYLHHRWRLDALYCWLGAQAYHVNAVREYRQLGLPTNPPEVQP